MLFPILKYTDNKNFKQQQIKKIQEELNELRKSKSVENELEEIFDIIQVCISLIVQYRPTAITKANDHHITKLQERKWKMDRENFFSLLKMKSVTLYPQKFR